MKEGYTYLQSFLRGKKPSSCFLIFAQGRTGTWLMYHFLNAHPAIACEKEILMSRKWFPTNYVQKRSQLVGGKIYGCHVQINQLLHTQSIQPASFLMQLNTLGWKIIYMRRKDIVRQSISNLLANHRQQWYSYDLKEVNAQPIQIDIPNLTAWLERRTNHNQIEAANLEQLPHLEVIYEEDLKDANKHQSTMDKVFDFLEVESISVVAKTKKLSNNNLRNVISNYDDLLSFLDNSGYSKYTDLC